MRAPIAAASLFAIVVCGSGVASAQTSSTPHRLTVAGGVLWSGGYDIGENSADLRQNAPGPTPPPFTLFRTESSFGSAAGVEARIGFAFTRSLAVEGGFAYSQPHVNVKITDDVEAGDVSFDGETTSRYVVEGSLVWTLPVVRDGARLRPYAIGGAGYLRQLHEDRALVENGQLYHVGAGVKYFWRGADGSRRPLGLRADVRAYIRKDGIELEDKVRTYPAVSASVFFGF